MKLFDERALGGGMFVTVEVEAKGRVRWERPIATSTAD